MGGASGSAGGVVATVNGSKITQIEYERTFNNLIKFYREQFQSQFSEELIQKLDLKTQALDVLVQKKLLILKANELKVLVSNEEVIKRIHSLPAFQRDKKFSNTVYQNFLKFKRLTPLEFEESQRESLLLEKIENFIKSNVKISAGEIDEAFKKNNERVKLDYTKFSKNHFKSYKNVTQEEIKSFYKKNKIRFEIPEKIKTEYVKVIPKNYEQAVDIQNEDIEDYYDVKIADFKVKKTYKAAHILFRLEPQSDSTEKSIKKAEEEAKLEADNISEMIKGGADFEKLAKKYSDDPESGKNGGSLGEFSKGIMVPEFERALEKLKPGETSQPIRTNFGYHIIRLEGVKPERIKPLEEVKEEIIQKIKETKTRQKVRRVAKHIFRSAQEDDNLARAAKENQLAVQYTPFISREEHIVPEIGNSPAFFNKAFSIIDNKIGEPIHQPEASFILKVIAREKSYIPELTNVQKLAQKKAQEEKDLAFSINKTEEIAKKISSGIIDLESAVKELKLELKQTPFFSRFDSIQGIGNLKKVKDKAFKLNKGQTGLVSSRNNYYFIRVKDHEKVNTPDAEVLKDLAVQLKLEKGNSVFQEWLKNLKENSEILIDKAQL